jgi:hypothetical protein
MTAKSFSTLETFSARQSLGISWHFFPDTFPMFEQFFGKIYLSPTVVAPELTRESYK